MEGPSDAQVQRLRAMSFAERWRAARALDSSARHLKAAFLRSQHPDWTDAEIQSEVRRIFMNVRD